MRRNHFLIGLCVFFFGACGLYVEEEDPGVSFRTLPCEGVIEWQSDISDSDGGSRWRNWFDSERRRTRFEMDDDLDDVADQIELFSYPSPEEVRSALDEDGDGTIDSRSVTTLDATGRTLVIETDSDGDGDADVRETFVYGEDFREVETDVGIDGEIDERWTAFLDPAGRELQTIWDENGDGEPELVSSYARDDRGREISILQYEDGNQAPTTRVAFDWLDDRSFTSTSDYELDGVIDSTSKTRLDGAGNLLRVETEYHSGESSLLRMVARMSYDCLR